MRQYTQTDDRDVSLMAIDQYLRWVRSIPTLTYEEEAQLLARVERGKHERVQPCPDERVLAEAKQARDQLVESFQRLVLGMARRHVQVFRGMQLADLVQEGTIGLLFAIERYDHAAGYPLAVPAAYHVRWALLQALYSRDGVVRLASYTHQALRQMRLAEGRLVAALGREPTVQEMAREMGVDEAVVVDLLGVHSCKQVPSLEGLLMEEQDEEGCGFVSLFAEAGATDAARQQALGEALHEAFETALTPRQREVLRLRYGLAADTQRAHSQSEVAALLGTSRENVRNVERVAKAKLAAVLRPVVREGQRVYALRQTRHEQYYTAREAMQRLGQASTTFYRHVHRGHIPGVRGQGRKDVWLFSKEVIDRLAQGRGRASA